MVAFSIVDARMYVCNGINLKQLSFWWLALGILVKFY